MVTYELIVELENAEKALHSIPSSLNNTEYMKEWDRLEAEVRKLQLKSCLAVHEQTKNLNSLDMILMVYKDKITSHDLKGFYRMRAVKP